MQKAESKLAGLARKAKQTAKTLQQEGKSSVAKLQNRHFCIGITGLSQSGKSTFITSLINQLLNHEKASLAGFPPVLSERLLSVRVRPLDDSRLPMFAYDANYQSMTGSNPQWPESTKTNSGCLLELRLANTGKTLNPLRAEQFSLFLEIRDYPGEWLLDLPLLNMSYQRWCQQCLALYQASPRRELLGDLFNELQLLDPFAPVDHAVLEDLNHRFTAFLHACKYQANSLSLIQPGRFLLPESNIDAQLLSFVPLLSGFELEDKTIPEGSYLDYCQKQYQAYVKQLVEPFYKGFFSRIDRQLVLVDVVNNLNAGPAYLADMQQAMTHIAESFTYGNQSRLRQLFKAKIDKVIFAATKIDQVLSEDHDAVRQLLGVVVQQAYKNAQYEGVQPVCEATAAVRASREIVHQGEAGLAGKDKSGDGIGYIHPTIPQRIPEGDEWLAFTQWQIPSLNPPAGLSFANQDVLPHIRLDTILNELIGDKCR